MADNQFTVEELLTEEWRDVVGHEGYYLVSNLGRVKSTPGDYRNGRVLKPSNNGGYRQVMMCRKYQTTTRKIHTLVASAFLGPCPVDKEVNHIDRVRSNNRVSNLEYLTRKKNIHHSIENFTAAKPRGERQHKAKLTDANVRAIRALRAAGATYSTIRRHFSPVELSISAIYCVCKGRTWKHVI